MSRSRLNDWLNEEKPSMRDYQVSKLAAALGKTFDEVSARVLTESNVAPAGRAMRSVPLVNSIAAGPFRDDRAWDKPTGAWFMAPVGSAEAFALRVSGDSMEPRYYDGDIIVCEVVPDPAHARIVDGHAYAVQLSDDQFYEQCFKALFNTSDPRVIVARPLNPETRPRETRIDRRRISKLAKATWVNQRDGTD
ncbi:hypothetical protein IPV69_05970 [Humisphaera borealis]|uniref:Peptidase S24/S26A/S26B/S26C domain-containing protein n=1 Tax=Humisphaera borealis TaxID=2807512 RepID=A0A7M2WZK6_9BACT|nr:hypothetical protein IPV69_05970 [Humisphaera borealis]